MARRTYDEADMARVYVVLMTNEGNVKRTARDTDVPENTVRRWKKKWEAEGPPSLDEVEAASGEFLEDAERVRYKALRKIEERIDSGDGTLAQLTTVLGVLTDKIDRAKGINDARVEHKLSLPSPDEIREALGAVYQGALQAAKQRQEEIIDAEVVEQSGKELPPPSK